MGSHEGMSSSEGANNFGHAMKEHFLFEPTWKNLNHGSFGSYPKSVRAALQWYQDLTEFAPDRFLIYQHVDFLDEARRQVAAVVNAPVDECVFVPNATTGVNVALRNLKWKEKDALIYFDTVYGACEKTLVSIQEMAPQLHLRKVTYTLPCTHKELCDAFAKTVALLRDEGFKPKAALFDTIVSMPGIRFPFERLTQMCKEYKILSVIDAAHAIGQIPLDLSVLDPDFLVTNCHKWLYTPRGCALFFVPKRNQHLIRTTLPTSHGFVPADPESSIRVVLPPSSKSYFVNNFEFVGTFDSGPYFCVPAALEFRRQICKDEAEIHAYIRDIAQRGGDLLANVLGTKVMDDLEPSEAAKRTNWTGGLRDCAMSNVLLPIRFEGADAPREAGEEKFVSVQLADVNTHRVWMQTTLINEFNTHVQIFAYANRLWIRISGQIYVELSDFEWLGDVLKQLLLRVQRGESLQAATPFKVRSPGLFLSAPGRAGNHIVADGNIS